jgi:hypothetical protein
VAPSAAEYEIPTVPLGNDVVVIEGNEAIVIDSGCAADVLPAASLTVMLKEYVPLPVGVPEIAPVEEFSVKPDGNEPLATVHA